MRLSRFNESDFPSHIKLKPSTRARRMALRMDTRERLFTLVLPPGASLKKALSFAQKHEDWMLSRLEELPTPISFTDGACLPVFGQVRYLRISFDKTLKRTNITLKEKEIFVSTNKEDPAPRIVRFLKKLAIEHLQELATQKAQSIGKTVSAVSVRDTTSRWGSCSTDGRLSFSWRLIFAPPAALDYVVAHEVAHLEHLNHSKAFWNVCRDLSNDYLEGRHWMDNHGAELMRFG
ncbi:MAG: M48 family metallopeptidase [Alphaproteobacteria bacterium]|nr:M48 family metallopeptidase [Alphaproteobacteria bacterium]